MTVTGNRSFEQRAREEVERIKALKVQEEERKKAKMEELAAEARLRREERAAEEALRKAERDAKLARDREDKAAHKERLAKKNAWLSWQAQGGSQETFNEEWPSMWRDMLRRGAIRDEQEVREAHRRSKVSSI